MLCHADAKWRRGDWLHRNPRWGRQERAGRGAAGCITTIEKSPRADANERMRTGEEIRLSDRASQAAAPSGITFSLTVGNQIFSARSGSLPVPVRRVSSRCKDSSKASECFLLMMRALRLCRDTRSQRSRYWRILRHSHMAITRACEWNRFAFQRRKNFLPLGGNVEFRPRQSCRSFPPLPLPPQG